ncbi:MAG TPA: hypothetical protein ENJ42_01030 [Hellea balneolensis]|uniref:Uncharacterized protein n=1 Tax=Hellea balneolensis TaxID=287478 RepID=A0A7C5LVV2_9PROT|nr:hypothetical protein [Hellea balneolensis]
MKHTQYAIGLLLAAALCTNTYASPARITLQPKESTVTKTDKPVQYAQGRPLVSGQRVRVKKLTRDMNNVRNDIKTTGPSPYQLQVNVDKINKRLNQFADAVERYPQVNDPDVRAARNAFGELRKAVIAEFERGQAQLKKLGNTQKRLATIEANSRKYAAPKPLKPPFGEQDAKDWVKKASEARTVAEHNLKELAAIAKLAYLPNNRGTVQSGAPYDSNDVRRLQNMAQGMLNQGEAGYKAMAQDLKNYERSYQLDIFDRFQEDPKGDKKWVYIGENRAKMAMDDFNKYIKIAKSAVYLEEALGRDSSSQQALVKKLEAAKSKYLNNVVTALNTSKLPKPATKNGKMRKIAKKIVETPKYEFGKHGPIVITSKKITTHEREESEFDVENVDVSISGDVKLSGTKTTWKYKWKEFQFAVPLKEKDKDEWYIWWITAKNFSSGGPTTPLNKWISGKVSKGNMILEKNF